jgi:spore cortex biosynthesis protein YabQ
MSAAENIIAELLILKDAFLVGLAMVVVYDLFRLLRRIIPHGVIWISIEDSIYWILFGVLFFVLLYRENDGVMRLYIVIGIIIGAVAYYLLIGRFLFRFLADNIIKLKKQLKKMRKAVTIWIVKRFKK